ncbi:MAG TPA: hypothetical protein VHB48_16220 [Chitinophagaceae bacterium]|nr:hypothetical protein [Chitinophagaceae bacterium]
MIKNKTLFTLLLGLITTLNSFSQDSTVSATVLPAKKNTATTRQPATLSILAGSQGIGGELGFGLTQWLSVRAGGATLPYSSNNLFSVSDFDSDNKLSAKISNAHVFLSAGWNHFRFVAGAAYLFKAYGTVTISPNGTYQFGDIVIDKTEIGTSTVNISWHKVAPYAGITLFRAFPRKFFNINLDLGTYYLSSPKTSIVATGLLQGFADANQQQLQQNMEDYKWLPVLQINFNFKL